MGEYHDEGDPLLAEISRDLKEFGREVRTKFERLWKAIDGLGQRVSTMEGYLDRMKEEPTPRAGLSQSTIQGVRTKVRVAEVEGKYRVLVTIILAIQGIIIAILAYLQVAK